MPLVLTPAHLLASLTPQFANPQTFLAQVKDDADSKVQQTMLQMMIVSMQRRGVLVFST